MVIFVTRFIFSFSQVIHAVLASAKNTTEIITFGLVNDYLKLFSIKIIFTSITVLNYVISH